MKGRGDAKEVGAPPVPRVGGRGLASAFLREYIQFSTGTLLNFELTRWRACTVRSGHFFRAWFASRRFAGTFQQWASSAQIQATERCLCCCWNSTDDCCRSAWRRGSAGEHRSSRSWAERRWWASRPCFFTSAGCRAVTAAAPGSMCWEQHGQGASI